MSKESLYKILNFVNIAAALGLLVTLYLYFKSIPENLKGDIDKSLFKIIFTLDDGTYLQVFNIALLIFIIVFILQLGLLIFGIKFSRIKNPIIVENLFMNTVISFLLVVSHVAFQLFFPDGVRGTINHKFFTSEIPRFENEIVTAYNFSYIIIILYLAYNVYIAIRLMNDQKGILKD